MIEKVRASLRQHHDRRLVDELLAAYDEAKRSFYQGGHRLSAVEGGRFCEAAYRILEERAFGAFTDIGRTLDTEGLTRRLGGLPRSSVPDSIRLHIPRSLRVVYDIRNNRDAAHLADGIDPNVQDATLVISVISWVLAELVREYHAVSADEAQQIVDALSSRKAPIIQEFGGFLKVLRADLRAGDYLLVLLYHVGDKGATLAKLSEWVRPAMRANLRRTVSALDDKALVHNNGEVVRITMTGVKYVEDRRILQLA